MRLTDQLAGYACPVLLVFNRCISVVRFQLGTFPLYQKSISLALARFDHCTIRSMPPPLVAFHQVARNSTNNEKKERKNLTVCMKNNVLIDKD